MNGLGTSQLDLFLTFSELHLLVLTSKWRLVGLHPGNRHFLGWDETTIDSFQFKENFLDPNHLDVQHFLGEFNNKDYIINNYYWRDINEQITGPYETYFRIKKENGQIKSLMVFVKLIEKSDKVEIAPHDKYKLFLAKLLPGLIHNLNGPLGTLSGRIELLNYKHQEIEELNEILKMGFKLQSMLENLSFKIVNERYFQPVEINLNRLLREEIKFLDSDLFFKHQVNKQEKFSPNIPQFQMYYLAISGVLSECYHFFRNFVYEDQEYIMDVGSFIEEQNAGFYLNLLGDFHVPENNNLRFPFALSGDAIEVSQQKLDGIDRAFLVYCLKQNHGNIDISGRKERLSMRLEFPLS